MTWANVNWKVVLDQLHNILIAGGAIVSEIGFSAATSNNILAYGGLALTIIGSIVSGANVHAAATGATPSVPNVSSA